MRSNPKLLILAAGLLLALLLAGAALTSLARDDARPEAVSAREAARPETMRAGAFNPPHEAPEFSLRGSDGSEVTLARYRGKVVLLTFGSLIVRRCARPRWRRSHRPAAGPARRPIWCR